MALKHPRVAVIIHMDEKARHHEHEKLDRIVRNFRCFLPPPFLTHPPFLSLSLSPLQLGTICRMRCPCLGRMQEAPKHFSHHLHPCAHTTGVALCLQSFPVHCMPVAVPLQPSCPYLPLHSALHRQITYRGVVMVDVTLRIMETFVRQVKGWRWVSKFPLAGFLQLMPFIPSPSSFIFSLPEVRFSME